MDDKLLSEFDELTKKLGRHNQVDRIEARLDFLEWRIDNNLSQNDLEDMKNELKKRGMWFTK